MKNRKIEEYIIRKILLEKSKMERNYPILFSKMCNYFHFCANKNFITQKNLEEITLFQILSF
ncbi:hypothetical protein DWZ69_00430 [Eubacterium sp. AF34-35BH]|nr:hypothetical protein DW006_04690 [Eubacterium sp. AF36-5BH]RHP23414.1 hypothetical protein DWZ69_00430 [Eubacterium sp. AF34-35BH]